MAYPTSIDTFTVIDPGDPENAPSHAGRHNALTTAVNAVETELGVTPRIDKSVTPNVTYATVAARLDAMAARGAKAGTGAIWFSDTIPTGWLLCDGAPVSRTTFAALFAAIGVVYGPGDGATTFNLPDLRGRMPIGEATSGPAFPLGHAGGADPLVVHHAHTQPLHAHDGDAHEHTIDPPNTTSGDGADFNANDVNPGGGATKAGRHTHGVDIPPFVSGGVGVGATTGQDGNDDTGTASPPFLTVNFIVKT